MKLYLLIQDKFQEEDFGNLAHDEQIIHGVFRNLDKAKEVASKIPQETFYAQFGNGLERLYLLPIETNVDLSDIDYKTNLLT